MKPLAIGFWLLVLRDVSMCIYYAGIIDASLLGDSVFSKV